MFSMYLSATSSSATYWHALFSANLSPPPIVCQTSAAWKRCSCVFEPRVSSTAEQTGRRTRCHPKNGGRSGTGGAFSLWGDGTRGGTHPAGAYTVNTHTDWQLQVIRRFQFVGPCSVITSTEVNVFVPSFSVFRSVRGSLRLYKQTIMKNTRQWDWQTWL